MYTKRIRQILEAMKLRLDAQTFSTILNPFQRWMYFCLFILGVWILCQVFLSGISFSPLSGWTLKHVKQDETTDPSKPPNVKHLYVVEKVTDFKQQQHELMSTEKYGDGMGSLDNVVVIQAYTQLDANNATSPSITPPSVPSLAIPKIIHITTKYKSNLFIKGKKWSLESLNPGYVVELYDDADMEETVSHFGPQYLDLFKGFKTEVERADFWRYLVMFAKGGIYMDSDVEVLLPIEEWPTLFDTIPMSSPTSKDPKLKGLVGIEMVCDSEERCRRERFTQRIQFCQWTFASCPHHPLFKLALESISDYVAKESNGTLPPEIQGDDANMSILQRTGPGLFTRVVSQYLKGFGLTTEDVVEGNYVVGGMGFANKYAFGHRFGLDPDPEDMNKILIRHNFAGSWK